MIHHLNSLFPSESSSSAAGQKTSAPPRESTLEGFHGVLSDAVSSTRQKSALHPSEAKVAVTRANEDATSRASIRGETLSRESAGSDKLTRPASSSSSAAGSSASTGESSSTTDTSSQTPVVSGLAALFGGTSQPASAASAPQSTTNAGAAPVSAQEAFDNAYWAEQPAAVQALRTMQNPDQRAALASQLANEGYSIDVPIMVWGWDPSIVTSMREADGYTWVPSALQNPVEDAPGLPAMGTLAAYNSKNPPAGSIGV
ncbi:MAG: hypothetical protein ACLPWF_25670 [Bryobacteraceae bacterium]